MPPVSLLIKPASSACNMRCKYCFYHDVAENRAVPNFGMMSRETLEILVRRAFDEAEGQINFAFQGGEPTLAGLDFYRDFVVLVKQYDRKRAKLSFAIQTNGTMLNAEWAAFLRENQFLVGLSMDGYKDLHDANRVDARGDGTFRTVANAAALLSREKVDFNILCVVNRLTARHVDKLYSFFKKSGHRWLQFIPCLDALGTARGESQHGLTAALYGEFLKSLFDRWYADFMANDGISIRHFDNWIPMILGHPAESCGMNGVCVSYFVIEADGGTYPCDFYVLDEWRLGNVREDSFADMRGSAAAARFIAESEPVHTKCQSCEFFCLCRGGCKRDRARAADGSVGLNTFCEAHQAFFRYALPRMERIAAILRQSGRA